MASDAYTNDVIDADVVPRIARKTLAEQAADELRKLILLETLKPGTVIPERETADALGVSRTPLREALRLLATEGLVEIKPLKAPTVANPSLQELQNLLQIQGALEGLAGELACDVATDGELHRIAELEEMNRSLSDQSDDLQFFKSDMSFHRAIVEASHNPSLLEAHATYNARLWRARFISSRMRVNRDGALKHHKQIAEALLSRDSRKASRVLRQHLKATVANIRRARQISE